VGFSDAGLTRFHDVLQSYVDDGSIPGLVALVARHGATHVEVLGTKATGDAVPLGDVTPSSVSPR
jgi:hypothetical protein